MHNKWVKLLMKFKSSKIQLCNIFCAPIQWFESEFNIWPLLACDVHLTITVRFLLFRLYCTPSKIDQWLLYLSQGLEFTYIAHSCLSMYSVWWRKHRNVLFNNKILKQIINSTNHQRYTPFAAKKLSTQMFSHLLLQFSHHSWFFHWIIIGVNQVMKPKIDMTFNLPHTAWSCGAAYLSSPNTETRTASITQR